MKVALVYVLPAAKAATYGPMARRFAQTYVARPPGLSDHQIYVAVNGGAAPPSWYAMLFEPLVPVMFGHDNSGKDIGAYQAAADQIDCDLLVCLGAHTHFHRSGWLDRIVESYLEHGPAVYSPWGFHEPLPHLRTTAFWLPPDLLNAYPVRVANSYRYQFEHGRDSIALWSQRQGFEPRQITWYGDFTMRDWHPAGVNESLFLDQHLDNLFAKQLQ